MKGKRFVALMAHDGLARTAWEHESAALLASMEGFEAHAAGDRLALIAERRAALAIGSEGFIIGALFGRGSATPLSSIDPDAGRSVLATRGSWLTRAHWGSYVAILTASDRSSIELVSAPLGDLPCYFMESRFGLFAASDVDLLRRFAAFVPQINWSALAQHLAAPDLRLRATCLKGLDELSGGERLTIDAGSWTTDALWHPWDFAGAEKRFDDSEEAAWRVRGAVQMSVTARANGHEKILLRLSGGLDSSIVAAALVCANQPFTALTLITHDRGGDERTHAQAVANHLGIALYEAPREVGIVRLDRSAAAGLPRPSARSFVQASTQIATDIARVHGASAIFDGGGGDNMFASLQSTAPVADCLRGDGGVGHFWRTARSIGIAAQTSTFEVARRALIRSWTRGPAFRWPTDLSLLSYDACALADAAAEHPWLTPPPGGLAGSAAHIALMAAAQSVVQSRDVRVALDNISPLITQPVAEVCLRVPGWLWTRDGYNRVVARDAFRDALPSSIINRRDKGAPDSFAVELIDANLDLMRAMLLDGLLARQGLLDTEALAAALAPAATAKGFGYVRIMQLVDAEAWARSWNGGTG